jgi:hypothetical protein
MLLAYKLSELNPGFYSKNKLDIIIRRILLLRIRDPYLIDVLL